MSRVNTNNAAKAKLVILSPDGYNRVAKSHSDTKNKNRRWYLPTAQPEYARFVPVTPIINFSGDEVAQYSILWLNDFYTDGFSVEASQLLYPGVSRFGIVTEQTPVDAPGNVWTTGIHPVLCSDYASIPIGSRIGLQANSYFAIKAVAGHMQHVGNYLFDQPAGLPPDVGLIMVRVDSRQGVS